jgi:hypothetical protein
MSFSTMPDLVFVLLVMIAGGLLGFGLATILRGTR